MSNAYYVFGWAEIATDDLCRELENVAGVTDGPVQEIGELVLRILPLVGGLPAHGAELSPDECTVLGRRLLYEACRHTLATLRVRVERRGYVPQEIASSMSHD
jgi:hypothetical protein